MTTFIALLCAVNVGGTGKLPMNDLRQMCEAAGTGDRQSEYLIGRSGSPDLLQEAVSGNSPAMLVRFRSGQRHDSNAARERSTMKKAIEVTA